MVRITTLEQGKGEKLVKLSFLHRLFKCIKVVLDVFQADLYGI